ncbi:MAG: metallophosphoesterase family protein [Clostridia bacterium]|nr:metallophosphoesterase family protein [Clostridia bacterium]
MRSTFKKLLCVLLACVMLAGTASAIVIPDGVKRVSCCMYGDGATGRGFCWFTAEKSASDLQLVKTADFTGDFADAKAYTGTATQYRSQYSHKVAVTDLEPGTAYTYRVGDAAQNKWSNACTFVTDDQNDSFSFITIADVQASSDENFAHAALTLKAAMETLPDAEFNVNLGDYVNDNTNDEWDWYFGNFAFANEAMTHVPVAGNHDGNITDKLNTFCFQNMFCLDESDNRSLEGVYYSFDYGNAHFAVLNTNDMYPMSQAQRNWLINDMSNSDAMWKIVLAHRSCYSAGKNINKPDTIIMREVLMPLFDRLDIDLVYAGHDHMYLRTTQVYGDKAVEGVEYVTETYKGEETTFAVDPEGTVYALPSTAGTKRYDVNEDAIAPILDVADVYFSTKGEYENGGGCFCTTEIDGGRLVYKAYVVNDDTQEIKLVDSYAISKSAPGESKGTNRDQSAFSTVLTQFANFIVALSGMILKYFKLLAQVIGN